MGKHDLIVKALASLKERKLYNAILTTLSAAHASRDLDLAREKLALIGPELGEIGR